jgi:large subunit ribosomal protein L29
MKGTTTTELREKSDAELQTRLGEIAQERFSLRFRSATESVENPIRFRSLRREVARIQTILRERERVATQTTAKE